MLDVTDIMADQDVSETLTISRTAAPTLTNGRAGYNEAERHGYRRRITVLRASDENAHVAMRGVCRVMSRLMQWLTGTHHGAVSNRHLGYFLDEFAFRFNRPTSESAGKMFYCLASRPWLSRPSRIAVRLAEPSAQP